MMAAERWSARSMVITSRGIVATSQTLASQAGAQVLARGGNAIDAAIAANAVLTVVEPMSCGIGGDLFAIYYEAKTGKLYGINASGWAPAGLSIEFLKRQGHEQMPQDGPHSVTVPGCVAGWEALHRRFGRLDWAQIFKPAIFYAENGFPVTEIIQGHWKEAVAKLAADQNARQLYLINLEPPNVGEIFKNPPLARAFRLIAEQGAQAFYRGEIAEAILRTLKSQGGVMEAADLAEYNPEWVEPISTEYRGWTVYELPPNGQGIAALEMLNIMEQFPLPYMAHHSADTLHYKIEAQKLAYADLKRYVGDPRFSNVPVQDLLSKQYAAKRARLISRTRANCQVEPGGPFGGPADTIYLAAIDSEGNIVSLIQSIYLSFGSGIVVDGFGFHLHNRGGLFELDPQHPNALQPRKRPFHTIIPGFMQKDNLHIGFGIMGGFNQAQAHAQFVSNLVDHGMNLQQALEAPRFTKLTFGGCDVMIESRFSEAVIEELRRRGHQVELRAAYSSLMGGGQAVMYDSATGVKYGASSPRKDGAAVPEPDPYF